MSLYQQFVRVTDKVTVYLWGIYWRAAHQYYILVLYNLEFQLLLMILDDRKAKNTRRATKSLTLVFTDYLKEKDHSQLE